MKSVLLRTCLGLALATLGAFSAQAPTEPSPRSPTVETLLSFTNGRDQRLAWWRESRFGMFIHWGVYSSLAGEWEGKTISGYSEHIQRVMKIPIPDYREKVVSAFKPDRFDANDWVRQAKAAGMGYLIVTAKHHDGVAMFRTKASPTTSSIFPPSTSTL